MFTSKANVKNTSVVSIIKTVSFDHQQNNLRCKHQNNRALAVTFDMIMDGMTTLTGTVLMGMYKALFWIFENVRWRLNQWRTIELF